LLVLLPLVGFGYRALLRSLSREFRVGAYGCIVRVYFQSSLELRQRLLIAALIKQRHALIVYVHCQLALLTGSSLGVLAINIFLARPGRCWSISEGPARDRVPTECGDSEPDPANPRKNEEASRRDEAASRGH